MTYKDLNVYQRAYRVAIDLHLFFLNNKDAKESISSDHLDVLKSQSREILAHIADHFHQRSVKAKRFFLYKALEASRRLLMDLEFLAELKLIPNDQADHFVSEYDICIRQLFTFQRSLVDQKPSETKVPAEEAVAA